MSISSALSNAFSGLSAASRTAEAVSNNIANAMTAGFARREVELTSSVLNGYGSGVRIDGVLRAEDRIAAASRRAMSSEHAAATVRKDASTRIADVFGSVGDAGSIPAMLTKLEGAMVAAASDPSSTAHLDDIVMHAKSLASGFNRASDEIAQVRMDADAEIARQVETLNTSLVEIRELNLEIRKRITGGGDVTAMQDTRQKLIDKVAEIIPLNTVKRDFDQVALFTPDGGVLLDGPVTDFAFTATPVITHSMTVGGGPLNTLEVNGNPVTIGQGSGFFEGGSLAALFQVRDVDAPAMNAQLDGLARDLVERFQDPAVDTTLLPTDAGIFTDAGAAFSVANETGLAGRLEINATVDPASGGATWHLRDGLNAVAQGPVGSNTILQAMETALQSTRAAGAGLGIVANMGAAGFANTLAEAFASTSVNDEDRAAFTGGELAFLEEAESNRTGVDTDKQMQILLDVEKSYAANARVMTVMGELIDQLLGIR